VTDDNTSNVLVDVAWRISPVAAALGRIIVDHPGIPEAFLRNIPVVAGAAIVDIAEVELAYHIVLIATVDGKVYGDHVG
jgi:hypothetical protein